MAYQMAATAVTLNDFGGHSPVAGIFQKQSVGRPIRFEIRFERKKGFAGP